MQDDDIIKVRKRAEKIVEDMPEGALKTKAFEMAFEQLLRNGDDRPEREPVKGRVRAKSGAKGDSMPTTGPARILALKDDGFFASQRSSSDVVSELKAHGWHYPTKTIATRLQELVQQRKLRRISVTEGKRQVWKYSNP